MPKKSQLISYTGKMPVEVDFPVEIEAEKKRARKEKRKPSFVKSDSVRAGSLTLRKNNTALISEDELKIVKASLGKRTFGRFVTEHGEHNPRSLRPKEPEAKPTADSIAEAKAKVEAEAEAKAKTEAEAAAANAAGVTVKPGKKGKGK